MSSKRLEVAAHAAMTILGEGGNGEGWTINDALVILKAGLGLEVTDEERERIMQIAPEALEAFEVVGAHEKIEWLPNVRGPAPWRCHACNRRGSGVRGDEPDDYPCLDGEEQVSYV